MTAVDAVRRRTAGGLVPEAARFAVVGGLAFTVDVAVFNVLRIGLGSGPLSAKVGSVLAATTVAFAANRHWTYRERARSGLRRQYLQFVALNGVGLLIGLGCLATSHYVLGLTSPVADNVSGNGVGLVLGTAFRFWGYRRFVFPAGPVPAPGQSQEAVRPPAFRPASAAAASSAE